MNTFVCNNCGAEVRRPTVPMRCAGCGQQRVGLFRQVEASSRPAAPAAPATGAAPLAPPGIARPAAPQAPAKMPSAPQAQPASIPPGAIPVRPIPVQPLPVQPAAPQRAAPLAAAAPPAATPVDLLPPAGRQPAADKPDAAPAKPTGRQPPRQSEPAKPRSAPSDAFPPPRAVATPASANPAPSKPAAQKPAATPIPVAKPSRTEPPRSEPPRAEPARPAAARRPPVEPKSTEPGSIAWRYPDLTPGQEDSYQALRNCPAVDSQGRLFAALGRNLVALAEHKGNLQVFWKYPTGGHIPGSPSLGGDGRIRVHSSDGQLHCVTDSGEQAWAPVAVGEPLGWAAPLVDDDSNTWVCAYAGGLVKIDSRGIRKGAAFFRTRQKFDSTGAIHRGILYIGAEDGFVYAIDLTGHGGKNLWDQLADQGKTEWFINSGPAISPDAVIVAGRDEHLHAFRFDGTRAWQLHIRGQMLASPVLDDAGDIYAGISLLKRGERGLGKLVCVSGQSHQVRWEYQAEAPVESTPAIGNDGVIYFGDNSGAIHAVSRDGQRQWSRNVGSAARSAATITGPNRVVFGLDDGTLVALRCSSKGLAAEGWPKSMATLGQSGMPAR